MDRPTVVKLPDGTHWLVHRGRGHQIRGDRFLFWAKALYDFEERPEADWAEGEADAATLFGGGGGIEKVAKGEEADPLGFFGVESTDATYPYKDAIFVKVGTNHYLVMPDGRGYLASGGGQIASLTEIHGPPQTATAAPPVFGSVTGEGPNDLFRPNEIEVFSGLPTAAGLPVDGTTGDDDGLSIVLPQLKIDGPVNPDRADPNAPPVAGQIGGATGDRTPGLTSPEITPPPRLEAPAPPDQEVPLETAGPVPSGGSANLPPAAAGGGVNPGAELDRGPVTPHQRLPAPVTPHQRPLDSAGSSVAPSSGMNRSAFTYSGTPTQAATLRAMRPIRQLPSTQYPALRAFYERTGKATSFLDRIEGGR